MGEGISDCRTWWVVSFPDTPQQRFLPLTPKLTTLKAYKERRKTEDMGAFLSDEEVQTTMGLGECLHPLPSP